MPGYKLPTKRSTLPAWADPETASVFDSTPETLAKKSVSAVREIAKFLGYDDPTSVMEAAVSPLGSVATKVARRVAPKKAVKELVDLLRGKSKRLPESVTTPFTPVSDADASLKALLMTRTGGVPSKPLMLVTDTPQVKGAMAISRDTTVDAAHKARKNFLTPETKGRFYTQKTISLKPETVLEASELSKETVRNKKAFNELNPIHAELESLPLVNRHEAVKGKPVRILTRQEIRSMLEGPMKAMRSGNMPLDEGQKLLEANKSRIDEYLAMLKKIDLDAYHQQMEQRIKSLGIK